MRIAATGLDAHLARTLAPLYTVVAAEPLLGHEALAAVRARARAQGHDERTVLTSEPGFRWESLRAAGDTLSLFASRRLVELRIPTGKPGREGAQALTEYARRLPPDTVTLISLPGLDWRAIKAAWVQALEEAGVLVVAEPFPRERLPAWIGERLARNGQRASQQTLEFIAERVEGNLSAAQQEVEKLALAFEPGELGFAQVSASVLDVSRHDLAQLGDALLAGDRAFLVRMLDGLRGEAAPLPLVIWTVAQDLRRLVGVYEALAAGRGRAQAMREAGVYREREAAVADALSRIDAVRARRALRAVSEIDRAAKGLTGRDPWQMLCALCLSLAAAPRARRTR